MDRRELLLYVKSRLPFESGIDVLSEVLGGEEVPEEFKQEVMSKGKRVSAQRIVDIVLDIQESASLVAARSSKRAITISGRPSSGLKGMRAILTPEEVWLWETATLTVTPTMACLSSLRVRPLPLPPAAQIAW